MTTFSQKDYDSSKYSIYRPTYHPRLYDTLYTYHSSQFQIALDVATGTGQVATSLSSKFKNVYAVDISQVMLNSSTKQPNVHYSLSSAEDLSSFQASTIDLITVAQAAHWFDMPQFFKEAHRVLKNNGTLAIWGYTFTRVNGFGNATRWIRELATGELGKYWEAGRRIVDVLYKDMTVPTEYFKDVNWEFYPVIVREEEKEEENIKIGKPILEDGFSIEGLKGYLKTWSSYKNFMKENPDADDPIDALIQKCKDAEGWKDDQILNLTWPSVLILARNKKD